MGILLVLTRLCDGRVGLGSSIGDGTILGPAGFMFDDAN